MTIFLADTSCFATFTICDLWLIGMCCFGW